jgi:hypothetical protein
MSLLNTLPKTDDVQQPVNEGLAAVPLFASVSREDLIHLCIFLAGYQAKLQEVRGDVMSMGTSQEVRDGQIWQKVAMSWPIIQGSSNQIHLMRIGELEYDPAAVSRAVKGAGETAAHLALQKANKD